MSGAGAGPARLGVLVSGRGTNLRAILEACRGGALEAEVVMVASNKPGCLALEVATAGGVPEVQAYPQPEFPDRASRDLAMARALKAAGVELVVTAGYDRVLDESFVGAFPGRIINVHPSLLPAFAGGMDAIKQAFDAGVASTGVTVHLIEPNTVDAGRVIAQESIDIHPGETLESVEERVHALEHRLLPSAIQDWIRASLVR